MKKHLYKLYVLIGIILSISLVYMKLTVSILFNISNTDVAAIEIHTPGVKKDIYTEDKNKITEIVKQLNTTRYCRMSSSEELNNSADAYISIFNKDGKVIDEIEYYGDVVVYNSNRYGLLPFTYAKLENLCNKYSTQK